MSACPILKEDKDGGQILYLGAVKKLLFNKQQCWLLLSIVSYVSLYISGGSLLLKGGLGVLQVLLYKSHSGSPLFQKG